MADLDRYMDGTWCRLLPDDVLELRDPNDGQGGDPAKKTRHQYRVAGDWLLLRRRLPAEAYGDRWQGDEIDEPWWEPVLELPRTGPVLAYWIDRAADMAAKSRSDYAWQARCTAEHVEAYTPNGREVRFAAGGCEVQPRNDNCWIACADLPTARRAYYGGRA